MILQLPKPGPKPHPKLHLDDDKILDTAETLALRVQERFPDSGLGRLASDLAEVARHTVSNVARTSRPIIGLRVAAWLVIGVGIATGIQIVSRLHTEFDLGNPGEFIQSFQAALESTVFLGASVLFLLGWENRIKRQRTLVALHELRTIAHLVDMHQLTKTPDNIRFSGPRTANSPQRCMSPFELARYFGYCSEMLSIVGKLATLYVQQFPDTAVLQSVDQIETLTTGLSSKIWQKSRLLSESVISHDANHDPEPLSSTPD